MSQDNNFSIPHDQFLNLCGTLLGKAFFENTRTVAKGCFRDLCDGKRPLLSKIDMDERGELDVFLTMDHSEYRGRMCYSHFRQQLGLLLKRFAEALENKEKLEVLSNEDDGSSVFKLPVLHAVGDQVNSIILAWHVPPQAELELRLLYLDPEQFRLPNEPKAESQND